MSAKKIEAELHAASKRLDEHRAAIADLEIWIRELRTTLRVMQRLDGGEATEQPDNKFTVTRTITVNDQTGSVVRRTLSGRQRPAASGLALEAGEALKNMLRARGEFIRPLEAVELLKQEKNIRIGPGKVGRETSDLSAALGHGRIPGLVVTRALGWGLADWNGVAPGKPQQEADTHAEEDLNDSDIEYENHHMNGVEAEAKAIAERKSIQDATTSDKLKR